MKNPRLYPSFILAAALALVLLAASRADEGTSTIKFSDPSKPGTLKIFLAHGGLRVQGADTSEITVQSEAKAVTKAARKDGLRVLTATSSFSLSEKDNVVTLDAASDGWTGGSSDFRLTVPRHTSVVVHGSYGGDIVCSGIAGDLEIHSMNGDIRLDDVAGGVVVDTMSGDIRANIRELHDDKPLSFTSMNGQVVLRVPADGKASVRLRTQNGSVLTDFDETALVTKTENTPRTPRSKRTADSDQVLPREASDAIRTAALVAVQAAHEAADAAREGIEAAHEKILAAHAAAADATPTPPTPRSPEPPHPPHPPMILTMTGGKLVTGTLNGGGPEISVATMNGDVTLRKIENK